MHGRLKVKSTAQQEAERKAARDLKAKHYLHIMGEIIRARELIKHEDESDSPVETDSLLNKTAALLTGNPDITTLWNIRREIIGDRIASESIQDDEKDAFLRMELDLSQACLMANPKSYGAWHHRCWSLTAMANPDWDKELKLCARYLSLDERNFHCWDYRRFVAKNAKVSASDELSFSMERIEANFSNYSAWHYRSKLLPVVYPDANSDIGITEEKRREELDLIQSAAFTDPEDSSAWFYHSWLLGSDNSDARIVALGLEANKLVAVLSKAVPCKDLRLQVNGESADTTWTSATGKFGKVWTTSVNCSVGSKIAAAFRESRLELVTSAGDANMQVVTEEAKSEFKDEATKRVLEQDLQNCRELLLLEPDSKWTLHSSVLVMQALDKEQHHAQIVAAFDRLGDLDPNRRCYFADAKSKFILERGLATFSTSKVDLSSQALSRVYFPERLVFACELSLHGNSELKSSAVADLVPYLLNCHTLKCDAIHVDDGVDLTKAPKLARVELYNAGQDVVDRMKKSFPSIVFTVGK